MMRPPHHSALRVVGIVTGTLLSVFALLPAAHAQTIINDTFEDAGSGATRTNRNTGTVPGAVPFYLATTTANANTSLTTTNPIIGAGSLRLSSGVGVAGVFDTSTAGLDFTQIGTTYTLTVSLQFPTGSPALSTVRIGLLNATNTSTSLLSTFSDHNYGSDHLTGFFGRFVTTSTGAGTGSNSDGVFDQPGNSGSFLGGSGITGSSVSTYLANAPAFGGSVGNNALQYRLNLIRTITGVTETSQYATSATGGTFVTDATVNFTNAQLATYPVNSFNMVGVYNIGAGTDMLVDNITLVKSAASPEPGSLLLLFAGVPFLGAAVRRRRKAS